MTLEKRELGKTGMQVSVLGFGGAEIGYENASLEAVEQLLGSALDAGLNVIDTAECYADSEEKIGRALSGRRNQYYLFTKCGHASGFDLPDWEPHLLEQSIDRSLRRLKTDYLDLVHLHSCSEELLRKGEVIEVLQKAKAAGKTRYIGYSGDSSAALYAVESGVFDTLQTSINIADQEAIELTIPVAREKGIGVIAKRPIANAAWRFNIASAENGSPPSYWEPYLERLKQLDYDFLKSELHQSIATALRFTLSIEGVSTAIVGTKKPDRWQQNAKLLTNGSLGKEEFDSIRERWRAVAQPDWVGQT
jgi:aryl-alcohol dehydrogenase-like predicted oxidoreductase